MAAIGEILAVVTCYLDPDGNIHTRADYPVERIDAASLAAIFDGLASHYAAEAVLGEMEP